MVVVDDEVADYGSCYKAGERKDVRDVVYVFVADGVEFGFQGCGELGGSGWG